MSSYTTIYLMHINFYFIFISLKNIFLMSLTLATEDFLLPVLCGGKGTGIQFQ